MAKSLEVYPNTDNSHRLAFWGGFNRIGGLERCHFDLRGPAIYGSVINWSDESRSWSFEKADDSPILRGLELFDSMNMSPIFSIEDGQIDASILGIIGNEECFGVQSNVIYPMTPEVIEGAVYADRFPTNRRWFIGSTWGSSWDSNFTGYSSVYEAYLEYSFFAPIFAEVEEIKF